MSVPNPAARLESDMGLVLTMELKVAALDPEPNAAAKGAQDGAGPGV